MPKTHTLDKVDRKLLNLLQKDNQIPTRVLAEKVHISQPTCLRRLRELRESGVISAVACWPSSKSRSPTRATNRC
jgi:Lrp/AsnC family leucine-responsive transcriptional regulator